MTPLRSIRPEEHIQVGNRCFVVLLEQRYLVTLLKVTDDILRVSFPMGEFPVEGMTVLLEFHDDLGFTTYVCEVLEAPKAPGDGLLLRMAPGGVMSRHRSFWRVPVKLRGEMKDQVHPRRHPVTILDLSAGGLLVKADEAVKVGEVVDVKLALPGIESESITCKVIHTPVSEDGGRLFGCEFIGPDPVVLETITTFIRKRLRELGPEGFEVVRGRPGD